MVVLTSHSKAHETARYRAQRYADLGVTLPEAATAALAILDRVEARPPRADHPDALVDLYMAEDWTDEAEQTLATRMETQARRAKNWGDARQKSGERVLWVMRTHVADLVTDLADEANGLIATITTAARMDSTDAKHLLRMRRPADAQALADAEGAAERLVDLYQFRDEVSEEPDPLDLGTWRDRWTVPGHLQHGATLWDIWRWGIRQDHQLWWPTPAQIVERSAEIARQAKAEAMAEREAAVSSGAAWY